MDDVTIRDVQDLEARLSAPTDGVLETLSRLEGDLIILGVAGKMGPTLDHMARRALDEVGGDRRAIGVARFSDADAEARLRSWGVETVRCDLLDEDGLTRLPDARNVVYMAARKFGATGQDAANQFKGCIAGTWRLDLGETLSPGQAEEINRVYRAYPDLNDDAFVAAGRDAWLSG